jgi:hypothetical protein
MTREYPGTFDETIETPPQKPHKARKYNGPNGSDGKISESLVPYTFDQTLDVFTRWLILPDPTPVYALLGAVAANLLEGDPVWLGIIGPPSSAKTELLNSISKLSYVHQAATLTPAGLLSGTPKKQHAANAKGGLLNQIGAFGVISLKDFGSILSMRPDAKAEILAALREIYARSACSSPPPASSTLITASSAAWGIASCSIASPQWSKDSISIMCPSSTLE